MRTVTKTVLVCMAAEGSLQREALKRNPGLEVRDTLPPAGVDVCTTRTDEHAGRLAAQAVDCLG